MNWAKSFSWLELAYLLIFLTIYALYFWRTNKIGRVLTTPSRLRYLKFLLRSAWLGLFIMALMGPSFGKIELKNTGATADVLLAVDLSASMNTADLSPSRLEKAKLELYNLISQLQNHRIGVLIFSTEAYWQIPYTHDLELAKAYVSSLKTTMMPNSGSNLNAPLTLINQKLKESGNEDRHQVFILVTDGEDFGQINESTLFNLVSQKAQFVVLGVGTEQGGRVPGVWQGTPQNKAPAVSKLDMPSLVTLAHSLKAHFLIIQNDFSELSKVLSVINTRPATGSNTTKMIGNNKFSSFLLAGWLLAALDFILSFKIFRI